MIQTAAAQWGRAVWNRKCCYSTISKISLPPLFNEVIAKGPSTLCVLFVKIEVSDSTGWSVQSSTVHFPNQGKVNVGGDCGRVSMGRWVWEGECGKVSMGRWLWEGEYGGWVWEGECGRVSMEGEYGRVSMGGWVWEGEYGRVRSRQTPQCSSGNSKVQWTVASQTKLLNSACSAQPHNALQSHRYNVMSNRKTSKGRGSTVKEVELTTEGRHHLYVQVQDKRDCTYHCRVTARVQALCCPVMVSLL